MRAVWLLMGGIFWAGLVPLAHAASEHDISLTEEYKTCMQSSDYDLAAPLCENAAQWIPEKADKKNKYILDMLLKACDWGRQDACDKIGTEFIIYETALHPRMLAYLQANCGRGHHRTCAGMANYYSAEKNDKKQALIYARKHFDRHKAGPYVEMLFANGDKKAAYAAIEQECPANTDACLRYLEHYAENPGRAKLAEKLAEQCREVSSQYHKFISACRTVGAYYYKQGQHQKALSLWSHSCRYQDGYSCSLIVTAPFTSESERVEAALNLCEDEYFKVWVTNKNRNGAYAVDGRKDCPQVKENRRVPASIVNIGNDNLKRALEWIK